MKIVIRLSLIVMLVAAFTYISFAQAELTMEECQKQISELTTKAGELKGTLDNLQKEVEGLQKQEAEKIQALRLCSDELDGLKKTLEQNTASTEAIPTYTVGTWAVNRDCLWNIAKKPKIYDNAFLWPKIWQGNRDQIKNPDVIHPGQKLKIPPKAGLTKEENKALKSYWSKKREKPAAVNP
jgi:nucleoid-associated protein YgaU